MIEGRYAARTERLSGAPAIMKQADPGARADLRGRSAIVTGAGKGLGRAYAIHLAACGARVLANNRRHSGESDAQTSAQQTVDAIRQAGGVAEANWSDVADPDSGLAMVEQARTAFGRIDIVVANAGIDQAARFQRQSLADFRAVFDVGFFGNLHLAHAAWPHLIEQGYGRVILTASSAGLYADHGMSAYASSKAAVVGLMRALAIEGRSRGVLSNVISPYGYSQMTAPHMSAEMQAQFDPALVAPLVAWLASAACDVSGEVLVSGAGLVRRASIGESDALLLQPGPIAQTVHALAQQSQHSYASARESFAHLRQELAALGQRTSTRTTTPGAAAIEQLAAAQQGQGGRFSAKSLSSDNSSIGDAIADPVVLPGGIGHPPNVTDESDSATH